jgi:hypothetical protein
MYKNAIFEIATVKKSNLKKNLKISFYSFFVQHLLYFENLTKKYKKSDKAPL